MKTKLLKMLQRYLITGCKQCNIDAEQIMKYMQNGETVYIALSPDRNASGVVTGYHLKLM